MCITCMSYQTKIKANRRNPARRAKLQEEYYQHMMTAHCSELRHMARTIARMWWLTCRELSLDDMEYTCRN